MLMWMPFQSDTMMPVSALSRPISLIGLSGVGKSTVGQLLAARLDRPLLDTDVLVVRAAGRSVAEIFAVEGEARFRDLEAAALQTACAAAPCIIATGGGIVLREANRALLRQRAYVVWLDAPTETLLTRLRAHDEPRPLLDGADRVARLELLRAERAPLYADLADLRVATEGQTAEAICEQVLRKVMRL
jgi:shikimate kinase